MQIQTARAKAAKIIGENIIRSRVKRPPAGAAVMVRYKGNLLLADDEVELQEKLAKRLQAQARANVKH